MKENKIYSKEIMLVLIMYISPLVYLLTMLVSGNYINTMEKASLSVLTFMIIIKNKGRVPRKSIPIVILSVLLFMFNAALVSHKVYVLAIFVNFIVIFIPANLLINAKLDYTKILNYLRKFSLIFTILLPIYIMLAIMKKIGYFEIGFLTHINIISISFQIYKKEKRNETILILAANLITCLIWGSRSIFVANMLLIVIVSIVFHAKKNIMFYIKLSVSLFIGGVVYNNLVFILNYIQTIMFKFGIRSRNLTLFIQQLGNSDSELYLSGRESIYPIIIQHLKLSDGLPEGVAMARVLTNGSYYHAHNFILEVLLTFGLILGTLILVIFSFLIFKMLLVKNKTSQIYFSLIILIGFLLRSLVGTFFLQDFLFMLGSLSLYSYYLDDKKGRSL